MKSRYVAFTVSFALLASAMVRAEEYVSLTSSKDQSTKFADAGWSETVADPSTRDYLVDSRKTFKTAQNDPCPARSMTFGRVGGTTGEFYAYYTTEFQNNGVIFAKGTAHTRASDVNIGGLAAFVSPTSDPFVFYNDDYRARGMTFLDAVTAAETVAIQVESRPTNSFYLAFNDTSAYRGTIVVTSKFCAADYAISGSDKAYVTLNGSSFPGTLVLNDRTYVATTAAACEIGKIVLRSGGEIKPTGALTIDELQLDDDEISLRLDGDAGTSSTHFTVKDSIVHEERIKISLTGTPLRSSAVAATAEPVVVPLLSVPSTSPLTLADFELPTYVLSTTAPLFELRETGSAKTLAAVYYPVIKNTNKFYGGGNLATSAATEDDSIRAGTWADGLAPHADALYVQQKVSGTTAFLTPFDLENTYTFPGKGLIFGDTSGLTLQGVEFAVPRISVVADMSVSGLYSPAQVQTLSFDELTIANNRTMTLTFRGASTIILKGDIRGGETAKLYVTGNSGSTSSCETFNLLDGDNRAFAGKVTVHTAANRATEDRGITTLLVKDGRNLGGARSEFAYDALSMDNKSVLAVLDSATLEEPTRGIYLDSSATLTDSKAGLNCVRLSVTNATGALTIRETITLNGTIRKVGAGALALGGELKFLDAEGVLTEIVPQDPNLHSLVMTGGALKPLAARAMDGLDVVFSNAVSKLPVALQVSAGTTGELSRYGIVNLKTDRPFSLATGTGAVPILLADVPEGLSATLTVPVCTVRQSAAEATAAVFSVASRQQFGGTRFRARLLSSAVTVDGVAATTLSVELMPPQGMVLFYR